MLSYVHLVVKVASVKSVQLFEVHVHSVDIITYTKKFALKCTMRGHGRSQKYSGIISEKYWGINTRHKIG